MVSLRSTLSAAQVLSVLLPGCGEGTQPPPPDTSPFGPLGDRTDLPVDERLELQHLDGPVDVVRDDDGRAHIFATTLDDARQGRARDSSTGAPPVHRADLTFEVVAPSSGVLTVELSGTFQKVLGIATARQTADTIVCDDEDDNDLASLGHPEFAWTLVSAGESRLVVVDSDPFGGGTFTLDAEVHPPYDEQEPNAAADGPTPYGFPFVGTIDNNDEDVVSYVVQAGPRLKVRLLPLDVGDQCDLDDNLNVYQQLNGGLLQGQVGNGGVYGKSDCRNVDLAANPGQTLYFRVQGNTSHAYGLLAVEY